MANPQISGGLQHTSETLSKVCLFCVGCHAFGNAQLQIQPKCKSDTRLWCVFCASCHVFRIVHVRTHTKWQSKQDPLLQCVSVQVAARSETPKCECATSEPKPWCSTTGKRLWGVCAAHSSERAGLCAMRVCTKKRERERVFLLCSGVNSMCLGGTFLASKDGRGEG